MGKRLLVVFAFFMFLCQGCVIFPGGSQTGADTQTSELIKQVSPALVQIRSTNPEGVFLIALSERLGMEIPESFYPMIKVRSGSGFIIDPSGVVVTNHHVLHPGWLTEVTLADGRTFLVDGMGSRKTNDIGVIILRNVIDSLPYVKWARKPVEVGERIFMLGRSPSFDFAYKAGIVSHPGRLQYDGSLELHTPMPVVPGESGSAVFNLDGRVVGVVSSYYYKIMGVSACVPGPIAHELADDIISEVRKLLRAKRK